MMLRHPVRVSKRGKILFQPSVLLPRVSLIRRVCYSQSVALSTYMGPTCGFGHETLGRGVNEGPFLPNPYSEVHCPLERKGVRYN